jgi:hypothetical protein
MMVGSGSGTQFDRRFTRLSCHYRLDKDLLLIEVEKGEVEEDNEKNEGHFWKTLFLAQHGLGTAIEPKLPSSPT